MKCSNLAGLREISRPWLRNTRPSFSLIDCISVSVERNPLLRPGPGRQAWK